MADNPLIEALRCKGDRKAIALWQEAEAEAASQQHEWQRRVDQARNDLERSLTHFEKETLEPRLTTASTRSRQGCCQTEIDLAQRLYRLAGEQLPTLAGERSPALFERLAAEIPDQDWALVRVNVQDRDAAERIFPQCTIETVPEIAAGLEVASEDGEIRIDNTLNKRLERAWPDLIAAIMEELRKRGHRC